MTTPVVPLAGFEPARCFHRGILSPFRLPIPSQRRLIISSYALPINKVIVSSICTISTVVYLVTAERAKKIHKLILEIEFLFFGLLSGICTLRWMACNPC